MHSLIQAAEVWLPDSEATLLEYGAGWYGSATEFGAASRGMCFGRAEGLPGRAWDEAHPILLTNLQSGYFRRAHAAQKAGLTCGVAIPTFRDDRLSAVLVLFCGGEQRQHGAIELWRNDPRVTGDMTLVDGYYGTAAQDLLSDAREAYLPRGSGLPGMAWQRASSVFLDGLPHSPKFLRPDAAAAAGIQHGLALPCAVPGNEHYVLTLLGTSAVPIARRIESWAPAADGSLQRRPGHGEGLGAPSSTATSAAPPAGDDAIAQAFAHAVPVICASSAGGFVAVPIFDDSGVAEVLVLHL